MGISAFWPACRDVSAQDCSTYVTAANSVAARLRM